MPTPEQQDAAYVALIDEGATHFAHGDYQAAMLIFWQAFRLRPDAPICLFNLARTMEELKDPNAEHFYAAAATQGSVDASYNLAVLYVQSGRLTEAVAPLRRYLEANPEDDGFKAWAEDTLQKLSPESFPRLRVVWRNRKKLPENPSQKEVRLGIL